MSREFLDYVEDILDAMDKAEALLADVTYDQFAADFRIHFACCSAARKTLSGREIAVFIPKV